MSVFYENKTEPIELFASNSLSPFPHLHKEIELVFVKKGYAVAVADQKQFPIKEGDLFFVFPNQIHYYENSVEGEYVISIVSTEFLFGTGSIFKDQIPEDNVVHTEAEDRIDEYVESCLMADGRFAPTEVCGYFHLILGKALPRLTLRPVTRTDNNALRNILDFCMRHFSADLSLDTVSENLHLNKYYISHVINQQLNTRFSDYINSLRISRACDMLRGNDARIADISEEVGFGTIRSFNRAFLRVMNTTPSEYREQFRKSNL